MKEITIHVEEKQPAGEYPATYVAVLSEDDEDAGIRASQYEGRGISAFEAAHNLLSSLMLNEDDL